MNIAVKIQKVDNVKVSSLIVTDATTDYLPESATNQVFQKFKKSDVKSIEVIKYNIVSKPDIINDYITTPGNSSRIDVKQDGWLVLHHVLLPTKEWFDRSKAEGGVFYNYDTIYFIDGTQYYKYKAEEITETTVDEIITRNPINTTISIITKDYFSIFYLITCYIKLSQYVLDSNVNCKNPLTTQEVFNRDTIWMTINVIKYLIDVKDFEGAAVRLAKLMSCNNICKQILNTNLISGSCGCSK